MSRVFRCRSRSLLLTVWIAVLVQLNVFFHLDLHQRVLIPHVLKNSVEINSAWAAEGQPQVPQPFCPVCQIVRNGAIQPGVEHVWVSPLEAVGIVLPAGPSSVALVSLFQPSGRDPPRG